MLNYCFLFDVVRDVLNVPNHLETLVLLPIACPLTCEMPDKKRNDLDSMFFYNRF